MQHNSASKFPALAISQRKKELRKAIRARILALPPEERETLSLLAMNRIAHSAVFRQARTIALYWSLPDELSTHASVRIWSLSKRIVLPVVEGSEMRFYPYDPTQPLSPGAFDIPCPTVTEECPPETIDLMILPGTAFDISYGRLGRGKGFYDRYLSRPEASRIFKAGVCFDCQLEKELPREDHDRKMDAIFTPNRLLIQGE